MAVTLSFQTMGHVENHRAKGACQLVDCGLVVVIKPAGKGSAPRVKCAKLRTRYMEIINEGDTEG